MVTDQSAPFSSIAVIGAGAWGTALAALAVRAGAKTLLWAREPDVAASISEHRENRMFLPGVALPPGIAATSDLAQCAGYDGYLFVVPAQFSRAALSELRKFADDDAPVALCSKGVEADTGALMTEVLADVWPTARPAVLSGPSFARDVAQGLPTAVAIAAERGLAGRWAASLQAPHFRPYWTDDLVGAELGGAVKNVLAIAAGVVVGKDLGDSARAALIARGFAEFQRLGLALGAQAQTMAGLSGLGDLILTAGSPQSRNMSLGVELGRGRALAAILAERNNVSEGAATARAVVGLAKTGGVEVPICAAVADLVDGRVSVDEAIERLLSRPLREEA